MSRVELQCTDVLNGLKSLADGSIDLTVTSPPYNIGKEYERPLPLEEYLAWCSTWMGEIHRVTKPSGSFWLNLGYLEVPKHGRAVPLTYFLWNASPFYMQQEVVWHYEAGVASKRCFSPRNEKWLWFVKDHANYYFDLDGVRDPNVKYPNQKKNGKLKCNPLGKNPGDVWCIPKVTSGSGRASKERTAHPAQFPIAVVKRILTACSRTDEVILDPFAGSGSTLVAAVHSQRNAIGFEIRSDYVALAEKRICSAQRKASESLLF